MSANPIPSLFKWTGGKRKLAPKIWSMRPEFSSYFEPFLGGGALLFFGAQHNAVASDVYGPLIGMWKLVRDKPRQVTEGYRLRWNALQADFPAYFYEIRDHFNREQDPEDLNFLLRTCVNGIVRFNASGEFNNSFHLSRKGMEPDRYAASVEKWAERIRNVDFACVDYAATCERAKKGDFVYFDPPYAASKNRYIENLDLPRFLSELERLNVRGVRWALSFDGSRGDTDYAIDVPSELFRRKLDLAAGHSAVRKVLSGPNEHVTESLFLNY